MSRSVFDPVAERYDESRPSYPDGLYDAVDRLAGPLAGARVVDVAAGTGIASRALVARGAAVLAVDVGAGMLRQLRSRPGAPPAVVGRGEALPVRSAYADLVTCAQAWHWIQPGAGTAEAARVLRRGGALCVWWNETDAGDQPWLRGQRQQLSALGAVNVDSGGPGTYAHDYEMDDAGEVLRATGRFRAVVGTVIRWKWQVPVHRYLQRLSTSSSVLSLGDLATGFLTEQRAVLMDAFSDGVVVEPFRCELTVGTVP